MDFENYVIALNPFQDFLVKAYGHKYISKKKVKGRWVYEYEQPKVSQRILDVILEFLQTGQSLTPQQIKKTFKGDPVMIEGTKNALLQLHKEGKIKKDGNTFFIANKEVVKETKKKSPDLDKRAVALVLDFLSDPRRSVSIGQVSRAFRGDKQKAIDTLNELEKQGKIKKDGNVYRGAQLEEKKEEIKKEAKKEEKPKETPKEEPKKKKRGRPKGSTNKPKDKPKEPTKPKAEKKEKPKVPPKEKRTRKKKGELTAQDLAIETGSHVWGTRKDKLDLRNADDIDRLSPDEQAKAVTKKRLYPVREIQEMYDMGYTPEAALIATVIEKSIAANSPNNTAQRKSYMNGIDFVARSIDSCRTEEDVFDFLIDWRYLAVGFQKERVFSKDEVSKLVAKKEKELGETKAELEKQKAEASKEFNRNYWDKTKAGRARTRATQQRYWDIGKKLTQLDPLVIIQKMQPSGTAKTGINAKGDVTLYLGKMDYKGENEYAQMAKALGPGIDKLVFEGSNKWPKKMKDGMVVTTQMQEMNEDEKIDAVNKFFKVKARKPRKEVFRWEQATSGTINREGGRPVKKFTSKDMEKAFNFANVQFGVAMKKDLRAVSSHLEGAMGALYDLADMTGIDDKQVSFGGKLSIAFGARGVGRALAHYEGGKEIINITKRAGGGTLAHEWSHALDNILAKAGSPSGGIASLFSSEGRATVDDEVNEAFKNVMHTIQFGQTIEDTTYEDRVSLKIYELEAKPKDELTSQDKRLLRRLKREVKRYRLDVRISDYASDAAAINGGGNGYWTRPRELFARAFEAYMQDTLKEKGRVSSYLVEGTDKKYVTGRYRSPEAQTKGEYAQPYPQGEERKKINQAMKELMRLIADKGLIAKSLRVIDRALVIPI